MNIKKFNTKAAPRRKPVFPLGFRLAAALGWLALAPGLHAEPQRVIAAKSPLERGHQLTRDDLKLIAPQSSGARSGYLTDPKEAIGMTLKRRLRADQPITRAHLDSPLLVQRGQQVLMVAELDGIEAKTSGEAMKKGRKGEVIKVKNTSSQRVVSARITAAGVVRVLNSAAK